MDNLIHVQYNPSSDKYATKPVYQYDNGVRLHLSGIPSTAVVQVHYSIDGMRNALLHLPEYTNEHWISNVPNVLLAQPSAIQTYVYISFQDGGKTIMHINIPVKARPKPDGYEFTEEELQGMDYVLGLLSQAIDDVEHLNIETVEAAKEATNASSDADKAAQEARDAAQNIPAIVDRILAKENFIKTLNNVPPDSNGNINFTINGSAPDPVTGDFQIDTGTGNVQSVNGEQPDENGNVVLNLEDIYFEDAEEGVTDAGSVVTLPVIADKASDADMLGGKTPEYYAKQSAVTSLTGTDEQTAKNADNLGGKSPEYYLPAVQLLDNSDWRVKGNIINQRGQNSYVGSGIYTMDRWRHWGDTAVGVVINDGYITVGNAISQDVPRKNISPGMEFTIGYKTRSNVIMAFPFVVGDVGATVTVGNINIALTNSVLSITINGGEYQWAALYEGTYTADTLPPFVPTHPRVENLKLGNAVQPPNLLDNSCWEYPEKIVNQRNVQSGSIVQAWNPFFDRWKTRGSQLSVTFENKGVKLYSAADGWYYQRVNRRYTGESYTAAVKFSSGEVLVCNCTDVDSGSRTKLGSIIADGFGIELYRDTADIIEPTFLTGSNTVLWLALYVGTYTTDTLPPFVPPDPVVELAKCQQHYRDYSNVSIPFCNTPNSNNFLISLPFRMAAFNVADFIGAHVFYGGGQYISVTNVAATWPLQNGERLSVTLASPIPANSQGSLSATKLTFASGM